MSAVERLRTRSFSWQDPAATLLDPPSRLRRR
jgi:hypothetical protein